MFIPLEIALLPQEIALAHSVAGLWTNTCTMRRTNLQRKRKNATVFKGFWRQDRSPIAYSTWDISGMMVRITAIIYPKVAEILRLANYYDLSTRCR